MAVPLAASSEVAEGMAAQTLGFLREGGRHKVLDVPVSTVAILEIVIPPLPGNLSIC